MLTKVAIRNFKRFEEAEIALGSNVVFVGPNNSGKTTALQALTLWDIGLREWMSKRGAKALPEKRPGVPINRKDLIALPVPNALLLWNDLHVRSATGKGKERKTKNTRIDIVVDGLTKGQAWTCGFEFDYSNEESFVCRPVRQTGFENAPVAKAKFSTVPPNMDRLRIAYLPPMSGLADREFIKQPGEIGVLIGQGQTAQVLRNLCYRIYSDSEHPERWPELTEHVERLFGVKLSPPLYYPERSEITIAYKEARSGAILDLSVSGRGLQQTLLLLAHLYANPGTVLLLDEPDAHLEILRQRQTYSLITDLAARHDSQIIAASHSEVVLTEAAGRGTVVAFVGKPHTLNDRGSQLLKALTDIGWDQYYQAEQKGWVLYLEGPSDLLILRTLAEVLNHKEAISVLQRPFVSYVASNIPEKARDHFRGLHEAKPDLVGIAIFDRLDKKLQDTPPLTELMWRRREIENYLCVPEALKAFAVSGVSDDLFGVAEKSARAAALDATIAEIEEARANLDQPSPWSPDVKASDEFLDLLFKKFSQKLEVPLALRKSDYYQLARFIPLEMIDSEVGEKLDAIVAVARKAKPREE